MTASKFRVGDKVYSPVAGVGTIVSISGVEEPYPIRVKWGNDESGKTYLSKFTIQGHYYVTAPSAIRDITLLSSKEESDMGANKEKFKVGDHVWSPHFGGGFVTATEVYGNFPIEVKWVRGIRPNYDYFTKDGQYDTSGANPDMGIYSVEPDRADKVIPDLINALTKKPEEDEGVVDRMEDALSKKVDDAINPSHYQVAGIPEAIEIMQGLMTKEQFEGFLWGNIIKYAYRYGRKGDEAETAGKIKWYAQKLKELKECESE